MKTKFLLLTAILAMALAATPALADISFNLDTGNAAISGYTGPYATVDVHLTNSTHATITFTSLTNSGNIYLMGGTNAADVNVNAATWTIGSFSVANGNTGFTPGPLSNGGPGTVDGFGVFTQNVNDFDGFTHSADTISFILTNTSGTWATVNDVLFESVSGYVAAAHIFVWDGTYTNNKPTGALATGFASGNGEGNFHQVPIPPSAWLLAPGLLGLAGLGWRRRRRS